MMLSVPAGSVEAFGTKHSPSGAGAVWLSCLATDSEVCMVRLSPHSAAICRGLLRHDAVCFTSGVSAAQDCQRACDSAYFREFSGFMIHTPYRAAAVAGTARCLRVNR